MNLYRISQVVNDDYDTYDAAIVAAPNADAARQIHPGGAAEWVSLHSWCAPIHVKVERVGTATSGTKAGTVICASFNAG